MRLNLKLADGRFFRRHRSRSCIKLLHATSESMRLLLLAEHLGPEEESEPSGKESVDEYKDRLRKTALRTPTAVIRGQCFR